VSAGTPYCSGLSELRSGDEPEYGGKSAGLGELLAAEIPVPAGFGVGVNAFREFLRESELAASVDTALGGVATDDVESLAALARRLGDTIRGAPMPESVRTEISRHYRGLAEASGIAEPPVAVRSSAVGEDAEAATFAGAQESYLWVRGVDALYGAVRDCWASLYSVPAISYRARLGRRQQDAAMGVAVQLMVDALVSGVMFTCNPVSGDPSMVAINASWGLGLAVVGGEVTPDDYLVSKITREVVREQVNRKPIEYVADPGGAGTISVEVPPERAAARCLDERALAALVELAGRVQRHFGSHQDIEWAIARDSDPAASVHVLQSRPVTAAGDRPKARTGSAMSLVMGTFGVDTTRAS
jgi:pyruvate, water dikinase